MDKFENKDFKIGNELIAEFMKWEKRDDSLYKEKIFCRPDETGCTITPISNLQFHKSWNWMFPVINKIHDLEEEYPVVKNNFHILIAKRFTRFVYDWDTYCDHDKASETKEGFKKFQESSKDYRHTIFENNSLYSTWHAIVDFINWWNKQQNK